MLHRPDMALLLRNPRMCLKRAYRPQSPPYWNSVGPALDTRRSEQSSVLDSAGQSVKSSHTGPQKRPGKKSGCCGMASHGVPFYVFNPEYRCINLKVGCLIRWACYGAYGSAGMVPRASALRQIRSATHSFSPKDPATLTALGPRIPGPASQMS